MSDGSDDSEGGAGGDASTGGSATTGGSTSGGAGGAGASGGDSGGDSSQGGMSGAGGEPAGGGAGEAAGGAAGAAGAGGASGKVCMNPEVGETSAQGKNCADYCGAYFSTCAAYNTSDGTFADEAECLGFCELYDDAQLCCRAYHVEQAATNATLHCPHAAGNMVCN